MSDFALQFIPGGEEDKPKPKPRKTNLIEQGMSGVNEGIASGVGQVVDGVSAAIARQRPIFRDSLEFDAEGNPKVNLTYEGQTPGIERPFGSSANLRDIMGPLISDVPPQSAGQRIARRVGQEVGYGVPTAMTLAASPTSLGQMARASFPGYMIGNTAGDVGAGVAGQIAEDVAPDSPTAQIAATLLGGTGSALLADRLMTRMPKAPTRADVEARTNDLYGQVKNSGADLTPTAQADFEGRLRQRFAAEGGDPLAYPKANAQLNVVGNNPRQSIYGIEQARRRIRDKVARSPDEAAIGGDLMAEIDDYLKSLTPAQVASNSVDPQDVVGTLTEARRSAHQGIKHDEVADAIARAESRTATTGTAGNSLNAQSQEIRRLYDKEVSLRKPQSSGGYTPDEIEAMRRIVFPGGTERMMQRIGRFSPTTGNLQASLATFGGGGGLVGAAMTGNPLPALAAIPSLAGMGAQAVAENMKSKRIQELLATILNDGQRLAPVKNQGARAAIVSQLLAAPQ